MSEKLNFLAILLLHANLLVLNASTPFLHDAPYHLRVQAGSVRLLVSKQVWKQSRTRSSDCDAICVLRSDVPHMRGMGGLQSVVKIHDGKTFTCFKVCPDMEPIVRDSEVIEFTPNCDYPRN
ncbi:hypothetical protein GE061_008465 [Apolygus lucorum]|uniref:Uncharacterized protein n=1 Tax=Apolygus lucorum TaxID=248454 RepID=A0A6A4IU28_APOLU|nr:hypothetical protein GE061_008465 [Apolygus lucorum]